MAFNCPPKYDNKTIKRKNTTSRPSGERVAHTTEFAGAVHARTKTRCYCHLPYHIPSKDKHQHSYNKQNNQKHSKKNPSDLFSANLQYKIKTLFTNSSQNRTKK